MHHPVDYHQRPKADQLNPPGLGDLTDEFYLPCVVLNDADALYRRLMMELYDMSMYDMMAYDMMM